MIPFGTDFEEQVLAATGHDEDCRAYVHLVSFIPPLSADQELDLSNKMRGKNIDIAAHARQKLIEAHLRIPVWIASRRHGLPFMLLIQAGNQGLEQAADKYDPERGYSFASYARWWIRQAIAQAVAAAAAQRPEAPKRKRSAARKLLLEDAPLTPELAAKMDAFFSRQDIVEAMQLLTPQEREVVRLCLGLDDGKQRSWDEVAGLLGLTKERLRQIESKALRKLCRPPAENENRVGAASPHRPRAIGAQNKSRSRRYRERLAKLAQPDLDILRFKWGFADGCIHSLEETATKFDLQASDVAKIEKGTLEK